jgi:hypothetical protein
MRGLHGRISFSTAWKPLVAVGFTLAILQSAVAQDQKVDVGDLVRDTQKMSNEGGELNFVWWMPDEYWKASAASSPAATPAGVDMIMKVVHPYVVVAVVSGKMGAFAAVTYRTEAEVRAALQLTDAEGNHYAPLAEDKVDASAPALMGFVKPVLARMIGSMGENIHFYFFPGAKKDGTRICDPTKGGSCELDLGERVFKWRLPLGSLLPKQKCPTCGEMLSGAYKFCPYDGTKLAGNK